MQNAIAVLFGKAADQLPLFLAQRVFVHMPPIPLVQGKRFLFPDEFGMRNAPCDEPKLGEVG
jgi:hypothetical protein